MAHLLLMFQYMRTKREVSQLTAKQFKFARAKDRIKDLITKKQKYYTDAIARVKAAASNAAKMGSIWFNQQVGFDSTAMNLYNYSGMTGYLKKFITEGYGAGGIKDKDGNALKLSNGVTIEEMCDYFGENGTLYKIADGSIQHGQYAKWNADDVAIFNKYMNAGRYQQQQQQQWAQNGAAEYANYTSIWEQAEIARLEAEQDMYIEPLNYEETMMELEETQTKERLETKKEEMNNIKDQLKERIKEDAVGFGL